MVFRPTFCKWPYLGHKLDDEEGDKEEEEDLNQNRIKSKSIVDLVSKSDVIRLVDSGFDSDTKEAVTEAAFKKLCSKKQGQEANER